MRLEKEPRTDELVLMNFNIPRKMKIRFQDFLKEKNISQTSFLNSKIDEFIKESQAEETS